MAATPWHWLPHMLDKWLGDLRAVRHLSQSTIGNYAHTITAFCTYLTDPGYGWTAQCLRRSGTHPVQVVHAETWPCTSSRSKAAQRGGRFTSTNCRRCSTTPTTRSRGSGPPAAKAG